MSRLLGCLIVAALVAAFSWPVPARSAAICFNIEDTVTAKKAMYPGSMVFLRLYGREAREFMDFFNAFPPGTDYEGDVVIGLRRPIDPDLLLLVFVDGCYTGRLVMPPEVLRQHYPDLDLIQGEPA